MFSTGKMCKFNRTLYNTQLIQFARISAEFVVPFIRYQYRVKIITFSIAAKYLKRYKDQHSAGGVVHTTITIKIRSTESNCTITN